MEGSGDATSTTVIVHAAHSTEAQWVVSTPTLLLICSKEKQIVRVDQLQLLPAGWLVSGDLRGGLKVSTSCQWQCQEKVTLPLGSALHWEGLLWSVSFWFVCLH